jgi:hypothetical protein
MKTARAALVLSVDLCEGADKASILFGLDREGIVPLAEETPVFWVTAPTREQKGYGFAVNGSFEPDVGRIQMAVHSSKNREIARALSQAIANRLGSLWDLGSSDWPGLRRQLELTTLVEPYAFWESLWKMAGARFADLCPKSDTATVADLARTILWPAESGGLRKFYSDFPALPTGLCGDYRILTRLQALRFQVEGALDNDTVFNCVAQWLNFTKRFPPGSVCSRKEIASKLIALNAISSDLESVNIVTVVDWALGESRLAESDCAKRLGQVITTDFCGASDCAVGAVAV